MEGDIPIRLSTGEMLHCCWRNFYMGGLVDSLDEFGTKTPARHNGLGTNLKIDFVFVIVAKVNDVVAAVAGAPFTAQALGMDRKQN
jgi:hypothetical protein